MTKQRPIVTLCAIVFGSAFVLTVIAGCFQALSEPKTSCNPQWAHCEVHCGPEGMPEVERPESPEPFVEDSQGNEVINFDAMA